MERVEVYTYRFIHKEVDVYHASIVVFGLEYSFGPKGITIAKPKKNAFREHYLDHTTVKKSELKKYLKKKSRFKSSYYHAFGNSCVHFAVDVAEFLLGDDARSKFPDYLISQENLQRLAVWNPIFAILGFLIPSSSS